MRWIAHRGNTEGPDPDRENTKGHLEAALARGFEVECDVRYEDGAFWLGHDEPRERVDVAFLARPGVWVHAKTQAALHALLGIPSVHCFFQHDDACSLTSRGYVWTHSAAPFPARRAILTALDFDERLVATARECAGVCSDEVRRWRDAVGGANPLGAIRLLVLDADGVLTDGTKVYDRDGRVIAKRFCDRDFTAIRRFAERGVRVCILSADRKVTEAVARKRGIDFFYARRDDGTIDKAAWLETLCARYDVPPDRIAYAGDDVHDLPLLERVGVAICPSSAPSELRRVCDLVLTSSGGDGAVAEILEHHATS